MGGIIFGEEFKKVRLEECEFKNARVEEEGGCFHLQEGESFEMIDCGIQDNYAKKEGGVLYGDDIKNVNIQGSRFKNNGAVLQQSLENRDTVVKSVGGTLRVRKCDYFKLNGSNIVNSEAFY